MFGFILGVLAVLAVAIFLPVQFQKLVSYVRGFWDKVSEEDTEVK